MQRWKKKYLEGLTTLGYQPQSHEIDWEYAANILSYIWQAWEEAEDIFSPHVRRITYDNVDAYILEYALRPLMSREEYLSSRFRTDLGVAEPYELPKAAFCALVDAAELWVFNK